MISKKGAILLHWIFFGVVAAIGLFLYSAGTFEQLSAPRGPWQLEMINSFLYQSELNLMELDLSARDAGWKAAVNLAEKGGFLKDSDCGVKDTANIWNSLEKWCFPPITENVKKEFFRQFVNPEKPNANNPNPDQRVFSKFAITGKRISADGGPKVIEKTQPYLRRYTYNYGFNANLQYDFNEEYNTLFAEARKMADYCRNNKELEGCLLANKPKHWQYQSCDNPQVPASGRVWKFCVESPFQSKIQNMPVRYFLALDFTPTTPFLVMGITVSDVAGKYKITFPRDESVDGYKIYYTDAVDADLLNFRGKAEHILLGTGYLLAEKEILSSALIDDSSRCGSGAVDQEANKAYWCGGVITYVLEDSQLIEGKEYYFAVTAVAGKEESEISGFVGVG